jgi:hypothetical protein
MNEEKQEQNKKPEQQPDLYDLDPYQLEFTLIDLSKFSDEAKQQGVDAPQQYLYNVENQIKKTLIALTRMADWDFILECPLDPGKVARRARVSRELVELVLERLEVTRNLVSTVICGRPVWSLVPTEEWILYLRGLISRKEERRLRAVIEKFLRNGWRSKVRPMFWLTPEYTQSMPELAFTSSLFDMPIGNN